MSFTSSVKDELSRIKDSDEAMVSELAAMVRMAGTLSLPGRLSYQLELVSETGSVARCLIQLLHSCFNLRTYLTVRKSVLHKTRNYLITVPPQPVIAEALVLMGVLDRDLGLASGIAPELIATEEHARAYLRGAFMTGGSVSDPRRDAHLEIASHSQPVISGIAALMSRFGVECRQSRRRGDLVSYLKTSHDIMHLLRSLGALESAADYGRVLAVKNLRNTTNRLVNAEIANQKKATGAAQSQIAMIQAISRSRPLKTLPEALQQFCELRLEHPELSLRELGLIASPPLSKSAVGHRLRRLEELAQQLGVFPSGTQSGHLQ